MFASNGRPCQLFSKMPIKKSFYHMKLGMANINATLVKLQAKNVCSYFITISTLMLISFFYVGSFYLADDSSSSTDSDEDDICEICNKEENKDSLLSCDNRAFHPYCLSMSHSSVPKRDQSCFKLVAAVGRDYGFEGGKEYNLNDFQTVCDGFKTKCFKKTHPEGNSTITEDECEREYWRLVSNPNETCQVEHGTQHGR